MLHTFRVLTLRIRIAAPPLVATLLFCMIMMVGFPTVGVSQTLFTWPDSRIDVGTYTSIESCRSAVGRVRDSLYARSDTLFDTLPPMPKGSIRLVPAEIQTTAQRCMHRFPASTIPLAKFQLAQELYLFAGDDASASQIVARRLDSIPNTDSVQLAAVLDSAIDTYLGGQPVRLDSARRLVDKITSIKSGIRWQFLLMTYRKMMETSDRLNRPELTQQYGQAALTVAETVKDTITVPEDTWVLRREMNAVDIVLNHDKYMDSLRKSTAAYVQVERYRLAKLWGQTPTDVRTPVGRKVPEFHRDFVFPAEAKDDRFPRPGTLTLFIAVTGDSRNNAHNFSQHVLIRRLKQQFPELDIVLLASTTGAVPPLAPPSPAEEAALFQQMLLEYGKLPATLIVSTRPFIRLADPDRRRINQPTEDEVQWGGPLANGTGIFVDKDGVIAGELMVSRGQERSLFEFIRVVFEREKMRPVSRYP